MIPKDTIDKIFEARHQAIICIAAFNGQKHNTIRRPLDTGLIIMLGLMKTYYSLKGKDYNNQYIILKEQRQTQKQVNKAFTKKCKVYRYNFFFKTSIDN